MPRKQAIKQSDKDETTPQDNEGLENGQNAPETPEKGQNAVKSDPDKANDPSVGEIKGDYIDSDSSDIAASLTKILSVPTETIQTSEQAESKSDVLEGFDVPDDNEPVNPGFNGGEGQGGGGDFNSDFSESVDSGMFEDNALLAQIGVELIDMLMTYGAMAIAKDWDNEDRYSIKDKRKKKLEEPLQKILENREVKTAPELVFAFMLVVSYSPIMIDAVQTRRQKKNEAKMGAVKSTPGIVTRPAPKASVLNDEYSIEPSPRDEVEMPDDEDIMAQSLAQFKPKRKPGRPVGATDLGVRNSMDEDERKRAVERAKAMRKDGKSFTAIAKDLNVSVATATRWIRS